MKLFHEKDILFINTDNNVNIADKDPKQAFQKFKYSLTTMNGIV